MQDLVTRSDYRSALSYVLIYQLRVEYEHKKHPQENSSSLVFLSLLTPGGLRSGEKAFFTVRSLSLPRAIPAAFPFKEADTMRRGGEGLFTEAMVADGLRGASSELLAIPVDLGRASEPPLVLV